MKDFAAIDFETANQQRTSVCSVGIVIVRDGEIADSFYSLIKPEPEYYSYWNTRVHGLTLEDTMNANVFPKVWAEIAPKIEGLPLVAHNAPFDEGCLKAVFQMYQMEYPDYEFHCTCRASRRKLRTLLPNHQLQTVAAYCGYDLTQHHNAPFDEGCLKAVFQMYQMEYPGYEFHCTCRASRRKLGTLLPNHQLQTVAAYCGYDLTQHHNALADAEACAWIARELL